MNLVIANQFFPVENAGSVGGGSAYARAGVAHPSQGFPFDHAHAHLNTCNNVSQLHPNM